MVNYYIDLDRDPSGNTLYVEGVGWCVGDPQPVEPEMTAEQKEAQKKRIEEYHRYQRGEVNSYCMPFIFHFYAFMFYRL